MPLTLEQISNWNDAVFSQTPANIETLIQQELFPGNPEHIVGEGKTSLEVLLERYEQSATLKFIELADTLKEKLGGLPASLVKKKCNRITASRHSTQQFPTNAQLNQILESASVLYLFLCQHPELPWQPDEEQNTLLHQFAYMPDTNDHLVRCNALLIFRIPGLDFNHRNKFGNTPIHCAASYQNDPSLFALIEHAVKAKFDFTSCNIYAQTPLLIASQNCTEDGILAIAEYTPTRALSQTDDHQYSAFYHCLSRGFPKAAHGLITAGVKLAADPKHDQFIRIINNFLSHPNTPNIASDETIAQMTYLKDRINSIINSQGFFFSNAHPVQNLVDSYLKKRDFWLPSYENRCERAAYELLKQWLARKGATPETVLNDWREAYLDIAPIWGETINWHIGGIIDLNPTMQEEVNTLYTELGLEPPYKINSDKHAEKVTLE